MRIAAMIVMVAASFGCSGPAAPPAEQPEVVAQQPAAPVEMVGLPEPAAAVVTAAGYGTIVIGKPPAAATGFDLRDDKNYQDLCRIYLSAAQPGLYVLVEDGVVRRVTVNGEKPGAEAISTAKGIHVGSTEAEVRAAYTPLGSELHKYSEPPAKNLYYGEEGVPNALRFEIGAGGRVTDIHAGASPQLRYAEGCS